MSNKSGTWRFFSKNNDLSVCNLCNQTIKCPQSSTTLMQWHLQKYHKAEYKNFIAASKDVVPLKQAIIESLLCIKCSSSIDRSIEKSCSLGLFDRMKKALFGTPLDIRFIRRRRDCDLIEFLTLPLKVQKYEI